jgi:MtN3 and saliva related transmembrane protein
MKEVATEQPEVKSKFVTYYEKYMLAVGVLGQILFYAQAFEIFRARAAVDVSLPGFIAGFVSTSSWLLYGLLIKNKVLVVANVIAAIGAALVVAGILIYR